MDLVVNSVRKVRLCLDPGHLTHEDFFSFFGLIIVIIKALSQLCWGGLYEFCFSIPIYLKPYLHFLRSISTTAIHVLFVLSLSLGGPSTFIAKLFLTGAVVGLRWICPNNHKRVYLILFPLDAAPKCS